MASGPSDGGASAASSGAGNKGPRFVESSYIVTLEPNLGKQAYENHFLEVYRRCQTMKLSDSKKAGVERIFSEPIDSPLPTSVTYFAAFSKDFADELSRRRGVVQNIHLEQIATMDHANTQPSQGYSWGPARMSSTISDFDNQWSIFNENFWQQEPFVYNALTTRGENCTVYVLDTGYNATPAVELELSSHHFIDVVQYNEKLDAIEVARALEDQKNKSFTSALPVGKEEPSYHIPWYWCRNWKSERLQSIEGHNKVDGDDVTFHGTNMSLCVGSNKRGTASKARVVSIKATKKGVKEVTEKWVISALQIIQDQDPGAPGWRAVVNCSWTMKYDNEMEENRKCMIKGFEALQKKGVAFVVSAGNQNEYLIRKPFKEETGWHLNINRLFPQCLDFAYLVAAYGPDGQRTYFTNYIKKDTPEADRPKKFIWAPGQSLPNFKGAVQPPDEYARWYDLRGTSPAAALTSGVMACLLAVPQQDPAKLDATVRTVLKDVEVDGLGTQKFVWWEPTN